VSVSVNVSVTVSVSVRVILSINVCGGVNVSVLCMRLCVHACRSEGGK